MPTIQYLTTIEFGNGSLAVLADSLSRLQIRRPLLVSDQGVAAAGILARVAALCPNGSPSFTEIATNPTEAAVGAGLHAYAENGCDGIVAIGGGSPIDAAKGIALLATHPGPLAGYAANRGGVAKIGPQVAPVVAIPTTAGTGSEVGRAALLTLQDGQKLGFVSPHLIPRLAICDPELTLGLPPGLTAATGLDALSHCVETYLSPRFNPPADAIAVDGFRRLWTHLERAVEVGGDLAARTEVMMGALQGGLTFQKGLGAVHALSHALGGAWPGLHHGTLNALFLPAVLRFNHAAAPDKLDSLAAAAGLSRGTALPAAFEALNARLGLPASLSKLGVERGIFPRVAALALADHSHPTNPREASEDDYLALLEAVL